MRQSDVTQPDIYAADGLICIALKYGKTCEIAPYKLPERQMCCSDGRE
jgi:hypothetical protein